MKWEASIIVPVYNSEKTLRKCVESIIYGNIRDVQVILVDDCSTDRSWELAESLQKEFYQVKCVKNNKNSGPSFSRNHGIEVAESDFILFVDSDDWVTKDYISELLMNIKLNPNKLITSGFCFCDLINNSKTLYLWNDKEEYHYVNHTELFDMVDKIMIQNVWNKIFRRDIIQKHNIRFDEKQKMGEDFQFVLDYMQAAHIDECLVINKALYYYIRANNISLMKDFGWTSIDKDMERLEQLFEISRKYSEDIFQRAVQMMKNNCIYHIVRSTNHSKVEKEQKIESIMQDHKANLYYKKAIRIKRKEDLVHYYSLIKMIFGRITWKIQREKRDRLAQNMGNKIINKDVSIISQNCIGGVLYSDAHMKFLSPTINLYFDAPDFVKFVLNLKYYLSKEIEIRWGDEYPIGFLDDIKIYFMHYNTCTEAKGTWERRVARVNYNNIFIISTDRNGFDKEVFEKWKEIPYNKVLFTTNKEHLKESGTVYLKKYLNEDQVPDLIPMREFYKDGIIIDQINMGGKK